VHMPSGQTRANRPKILHGIGFFAKRHLKFDVKTPV
jgi:hypothetical protein